MALKIDGERALLKKIEQQYGEKAMRRIGDRALLAGAEVFVNELETQFRTFADTGASLREITIGEVQQRGSARYVPIHWKGPDDRYRIIHLNEFGTVKNPNPAGKGAIAKAMRNAEKAYREAIKREIAKGAR